MPVSFPALQIVRVLKHLPLQNYHPTSGGKLDEICLPPTYQTTAEQAPPFGLLRNGLESGKAPPVLTGGAKLEWKDSQQFSI
jgi:hypothetical protein